MKNLFLSLALALLAMNGVSQYATKSSSLKLKMMQPGPTWDTHFALIPGYGYTKINTVELNAGVSISRPLSKFFTGAFFIGAGYEFGIDKRIDAIKISFYTPHSPFHFKILPVLFTDHVHWKLGFRPEFGFALRTLAFTYGYSFANKALFNEVRGHRIGTRWLIPVYEIKTKPKNPY